MMIFWICKGKRRVQEESRVPISRTDLEGHFSIFICLPSWQQLAKPTTPSS